MNARIKQKYAERMKRTYDILQYYNANLADEVFQNFKEKEDIKTTSAIKIQKVFKGYLARKLYQEILYAHYLEEEEKTYNQEKLRMEEGLIMLENIRLEEKIKEKQFLLRQKELERNWAATVVQRRYRTYISLKNNLNN
jgi:IQ calmodulin-binding motif